MDALAARRDLQPAEQQVERQRQLGVLRIVHRVKRTLGGREVRNEYELAVVLLLGPLAEKNLFVRIEVVTVFGFMAVFFLHDLLGLMEADGRDLADLRHVGLEKCQLLRAMLLDVSHDRL